MIFRKARTGKPECRNIIARGIILQSNHQSYRDCSLSNRKLAARVDEDAMNVYRIWSRWVQEGNTECRIRSQEPAMSNKKRHLIHMDLMNRTATSQVLSQEMGSFERQKVSVRIVR